MMKHKGDWLLLLAAFIGGGGFISLKYLLDWGYDPFQVIFGRFLTASVCMCLVYCKRLKRITKEEWRVGSILGALLAAMFLLMTVGLQYTTPSVNAFLVNIPAVIVPFVCWGVFRQKPNRNCFLAAGMTLFGVCCLSLTADFRLDFGAGLSLLAAVAFSLQMAFLGNLTKDCDSVHIAIVENLSTLAVTQGHFAPRFILCCKASDSKALRRTRRQSSLQRNLFLRRYFLRFYTANGCTSGDIWGVR